MPDYTKDKIAGCYVYFTSDCVVEAFHAHADPKRSKRTAARLYIRADGSVHIGTQGRLTDFQLREVIKYIRRNYKDMYAKWLSKGGTPGYYERY